MVKYTNLIKIFFKTIWLIPCYKLNEVLIIAYIQYMGSNYRLKVLERFGLDCGS